MLHLGKGKPYFDGSLTFEVGFGKEPLLKEKAQYNGPPSAAFDNANIYFFKQATLMRRSTVPNLPVQLVFTGSGIV